MGLKYDVKTNELITETMSIAQNVEMAQGLEIDIVGMPPNGILFIELRCPKGQKFVSKELAVINNSYATFDIPLAITKNIGEVWGQLVIRNSANGAVMSKSLISETPTLIIEKSINATDTIPETIKSDLINGVTASTKAMDTLRTTVIEEKNSGAYKGEKGDSVSTLYIYPIGALYLSINAVDPKNLFGGTWQQLVGDAYLKIVTSSAGTYNGAANHCIPLASMPNHAHAYMRHERKEVINSGGSEAWVDCSNTDKYKDIATSVAGSNAPYYPYYYGVYMWVRTA